MSKIISFYLPQFHPIPENDVWWGKGFTEWTNVGKARPLYLGHYQPHVPADLGYYDLRLSETRVQQADLARAYSVDAFCYWHYWFGGKELLQRPFSEVLTSKSPDFPFCLGWANHSWMAKTWSTKGKSDKLLIEQTYPGIDDHINHFNDLLEAFLDKRYLRIDGKPLFVIWEPELIPDAPTFIALWNELAKKNGLAGIYFVGFTYKKEKIESIKKLGFNDVTYDSLVDVFRHSNPVKKFIKNCLWTSLSIPRLLSYSSYSHMLLKTANKSDFIPCLLPNYDHTPRSGKRGLVILSSPEKFRQLCVKVFTRVKAEKGESALVFIKSWNEWGEGNHLEPDLKYGKKYLEALVSARDQAHF